jgi:hypothetical protein
MDVEVNLSKKIIEEADITIALESSTEMPSDTR